MDRYLYIQSGDSADYFADNEVYRFKVHLNLPLSLHGNWKVALTEFYAESDSKSRNKTVDALYIYTDMQRKYCAWCRTTAVKTVGLLPLLSL